MVVCRETDIKRSVCGNYVFFLLLFILRRIVLKYLN